MEKSKLCIMCGVPGVGKSTWLKNHKGEGVVISRDEIRFSMVREDEDYFSKENEVYNEFIYQIAHALKFNKTVYADATHLNMSSRTRLLRSLGSNIKDIEVNIIFFYAPIKTILEQNEQRKGTRAYVPPEEIKKMAGRFTLPSHSEGFEHIYKVNTDGTLTEVAK